MKVFFFLNFERILQDLQKLYREILYIFDSVVLNINVLHSCNTMNKINQHWTILLTK